jgi:pimeloyl-ACP methyl ester carboxylesterase
MGRLGRILIVLVVVLAALLTVNFFVTNDDTRPAEVTEEGGEVVEAANAGLQVFDSPATGSGPEGQPIVLIHGFGASSQWWDELLPLLNEGHRVIRVDLIGHGGSEKPRSGYEVTAQSGAIADVLSQKGITRATVVGHSLGGLVATSLAESASEIADRLVLIGTPANPNATELPFISKLVHTAVIGQALWRVRIDSMIKSGYEDAFAPGFDMADGFEDPDQVVEDNRAMTYTSFVDADNAGDDFLEEESVPPRLTAKGVPLLVIQGAEDQLFDAQTEAEAFDAVPGSRVEVLEGVGHSAMVEDPEAVAELILPFSAAGDAVQVPANPKPPPSPSEPKPTPDAGKKNDAKKNPQGGRKK